MPICYIKKHSYSFFLLGEHSHAKHRTAFAAVSLPCVLCPAQENLRPIPGPHTPVHTGSAKGGVVLSQAVKVGFVAEGKFGAETQRRKWTLWTLGEGAEGA